MNITDFRNFRLVKNKNVHTTPSCISSVKMKIINKQKFGKNSYIDMLGTQCLTTYTSGPIENSLTKSKYLKITHFIKLE